MSLSTVYPRPDEPRLGLFVRSRLEHVARAGPAVRLRVIAPVPVADYSRRRLRFPRLQEVAQPEQLQVLRPHWFYLPGGPALNALLLFSQLALPLLRLRRRFPFELIDAHFGYPEGVAAWLLAWLFGCRFVVTLRGNETLHARYRLRGRLMSLALGHAARVITVSERLRNFAVSMGAAPEKVKTIPNGVETTIYHPRQRAAMREKYQIPPEAPVILSAGYLIERKGHHRAVQALKRLRQDRIPARLLIVGGPGREGSFEQRIRQTVTSLGLHEYVRFFGEVDQEVLAELMSAADVLCLASSREGWPNVVHEALSCGTPVVATDVGALPEMIPGDDYGFLVPVNDELSLAAALKRALQKPWDRRMLAAKAQARSWRQVALEVVEEFRQALAEPSRGQGPRERRDRS